MDLGLKGKTAVIMGGTTGIGAAAALRFGREGCRVAVCSHNPDKVQAFRDRAAEEKAELFAEVVDTMHREEQERFADLVMQRYGRIDIWVNCSGGNRHGPLHVLSEEDFRYIMDLNLSTVFFGIQCAARYMIPQRSGVILSVSSQSGSIPVAYRVVYAAAKAGVDRLTAGAAAELAPYGIRVNAVAPGIIDTILSRAAIYEKTDYIMPMIPLRRAGKPEEIGDVIVCMASDRFGYMTGEIVHVNGGKHTVEDPDLPWSSPWDDR